MPGLYLARRRRGLILGFTISSSATPVFADRRFLFVIFRNKIFFLVCLPEQICGLQRCFDHKFTTRNLISWFHQIVFEKHSLSPRLSKWRQSVDNKRYKDSISFSVFQLSKPVILPTMPILNAQLLKKGKTK